MTTSKTPLYCALILAVQAAYSAFIVLWNIQPEANLKFMLPFVISAMLAFWLARKDTKQNLIDIRPGWVILHPVAYFIARDLKRKKFSLWVFASVFLFGLALFGRQQSNQTLIEDTACGVVTDLLSDKTDSCKVVKLGEEVAKNVYDADAYTMQGDHLRLTVTYDSSKNYVYVKTKGLLE